MLEPSVTRESATGLTDLVEVIMLPALLVAWAWAAWRLGRVCLDGRRHRQGDPS